MLTLGIASASSMTGSSRVKGVVIRVLTFLAHSAAGIGILLVLFGNDIKGVSQTLSRMQFAQDYGGTRVARQAAQYWNFHTGIGLYLMVIGGGIAFLASFFPECRLTAAEFETRSQRHKKWANRISELGDHTVRGVYLLILFTVAIAVWIIALRWHHR